RRGKPDRADRGRRSRAARQARAAQEDRPRPARPRQPLPARLGKDPRARLEPRDRLEGRPRADRGVVRGAPRVVGAAPRASTGRRSGLALRVNPVPLWRNREFVLLESGRLLSGMGTASTTIAYPLLVLALTHSPVKAGVVGFARLLPYALLALPAGLAADRWNRKWLMMGADGVQALVLGGLALAVATGRAGFWLILVAAFLEGVGSLVFG